MRSCRCSPAEMCTQMARRRRADPGVERASLEVNACYRDGSIFLRTLVGPSAGIDRNSRDLSEVIGIQRDLLGVFAPATPHHSLACSQLPSVFACFEALSGVWGLSVPGWPFGVSWCLWLLWRRRERGVAVLLVCHQVSFCPVRGVVCADLCARHPATLPLSSVARMPSLGRSLAQLWQPSLRFAVSGAAALCRRRRLPAGGLCRRCVAIWGRCGCVLRVPMAGSRCPSLRPGRGVSVSSFRSMLSASCASCRPLVVEADLSSAR